MSFYRPGGSGSGSVTSSPVSVAEGGTGASTAADARNNLGISATGADTNYAFRANNLSDLNSASSARTNLGLGTIATQNANAVNITGGTIVSIVDLAVADGGTGASTAAGALANLLPSYTSNANKVLSVKSDATGVEWTTNGAGTVTSVDISVPTGLSVSGNPITSSGTLAVSFAAGYSIPTTTKQGEWDTAYGWGNHASAGYAKYGDTTANFTGTLQNNSHTVLTTASDYLDSADIGTTVQAYDVDTAKYDATTANFTGTLQQNGSNVLTASNIGSTVQAYDADTAKYDDATANFTGTLQKSGSNVLVASDIGTSVQAYDADTAKYDAVTANFTGTLQNGGSNVVVDSDIGSTVQAYDSNLTSFVSTFTLPTTDGTNGQVLKTNGSGTLSFVTAATGTVTSVDLSVPTGFAVSGNPVTGSGTLALAFASGYSLPTTAKQGNWDTAYGWGNHASAGYLTQASTIEGGTYA